MIRAIPGCTWPSSSSVRLLLPVSMMWSCSGTSLMERQRSRPLGARTTLGTMRVVEIREAVIVDTLRTPIGKRKGALANWHPTDLLGFTLNALVEQTGIDRGLVDDVVRGC